MAISAFIANPTACAAVVIAVSGAKTATPNDGSSFNGNTSAAFDTFATSTLLFANEFAVAMVGSQNNSLALQPSWNGGFVQPPNSHIGTNSGGPPNDTVIDVAFKALLSNAAVDVTGTLPSAVDYGAGVVTIKSL